MRRNGKQISKRMITAVLTAALALSSSTAALAGQWQKDTNGWWYQEDDQSYPTNSWKEIEGKWYYFDGNGYIRYGWINDNGTWYFTGADGSMSTNQVVEGFQLAADGSRIDQKNQLGIYVKDKNEKKETKAADGAVVLNYDVTIPLVTIAGNVDVTNKINSYFNDIKNKMDAARAGYEAGALEYYNLAGQANGASYEMSLSYESLGIAKQYLSFQLTGYEYTGGAHGMTNTTLVTFDTTTGEPVTLDSMAIAPESLREKILNYASKQIAAEHPDDTTAETVKTAGIEQWVVVDGGMKLLYNQYSIADYAAGQIEVLVPYSEYSMYLNSFGRSLHKGK